MMQRSWSRAEERWKRTRRTDPEFQSRNSEPDPEFQNRNSGAAKAAPFLMRDRKYRVSEKET